MWFCMRIGVDLHGTVKDTPAAARAVCNQLLNLGPSLETSDYLAFEPFDSCCGAGGLKAEEVDRLWEQWAAHFYENGHPLDHAADALQNLQKDHEIHFITACNDSPDLRGITEAWLRKHSFPFTGKNLHMTCGYSRKIEVSKQLGIEIFFDDYPIDIRDLIHNKIPTIIKDAPYNRSFPYPLRRMCCWSEAEGLIWVAHKEAHELLKALSGGDDKVILDESALFRRLGLLGMRDYGGENERERNARERGLSYVSLEGNIGCMVNGAGLAMATMDILYHFGGKPANFLDIGGNATTDHIAAAFEILMLDRQVQVIFINIFGGMVRCDVLAEGIMQAIAGATCLCPLIVRLEGTCAKEGLAILRSTQLPVLTATSMDEGARLAIQAAKENRLEGIK